MLGKPYWGNHKMCSFWSSLPNLPSCSQIQSWYHKIFPVWLALKVLQPCITSWCDVLGKEGSQYQIWFLGKHILSYKHQLCMQWRFTSLGLNSFSRCSKNMVVLLLCELFLTDCIHFKGVELHCIILLLCAAFLLGQWP